MTGKNNAASSYSGYDLLNTASQEGFTSAFFNWKQYSVPVSVNGLELRSNAGSKEKVADIQAVKIEQASMSLVDTIAEDVYLDGTGNSSKDITGLAAMIEEVPGTTAYASVPVANTFWQNKQINNVGSAAVNIIPNMRIITNDCSQGKGAAASKPDLYVTTQAIHEVVEAQYDPRIRYSSGGGDLGVKDVVYKSVPVIWSDFCTSGVMWVLNSKHIMLFIHRDANFSMAEGGFKMPINQDAYIAQILAQLNLATNNRRKLGGLFDIT